MTFEPLSPEEVQFMNPGIRHTVQVLREWGFKTVDSGDGCTHDHQCDLPIPYVHIEVATAAELWDRMVELTANLGVRGIHVGTSGPQGDEPAIEGSVLASGHAFIHLFNVVIPE